VFGVGPDRFDHQVKFIGAVGFARHAVGLARHEVVRFAGVMQPIDALGVVVGEQQHPHTTSPPTTRATVIGAHKQEHKNVVREYQNYRKLL